jgi:hypothetical protein
MSTIILYSTDYITVEYRPDGRLIYHTIHKPIGGQVEMLKEALNAGSDALEKYKVTKWLSDDRKNDPLPSEMLAWGTQNWSPRTIASGWKYWANVVPVDLAAAGALIPVIDDLFARGLRMQVFTTTEAALAWLDAMKD